MLLYENPRCSATRTGQLGAVVVSCPHHQNMLRKPTKHNLGEVDVMPLDDTSPLHDERVSWAVEQA